MISRIIQDITDFIFIEDKPQKADIIFIPGSQTMALPKAAAELWKKGYAPYVMPTGKYAIGKDHFPGPINADEKYQKAYPTECDFYTDVLLDNGVMRDAIIQEKSSTFTAENASCARLLLGEMKLDIKKAILCCKPYHARRAFTYFQYSFPDVQFYVYPVYGALPDTEHDNWYKSEMGMKRVLSELRKCGDQMQNEFANILELYKD